MKICRIQTSTAIALLLATSYLGSEAQQLQLVPQDEVPARGTFWFAKSYNGKPMPPLPFLPSEEAGPIYVFGKGQYLVDNRDNQDGIPLWLLSDITDGDEMSLMTIPGPPLPPGGGGSGDPPPLPPNIPNREKFMAHAFVRLDTNIVAQTDTNLYQLITSFPIDTRASGTLQIAPYGTNNVVIRANNFDYSSETMRDFALLICDKVNTATYKAVDLSGSSDAQDGWLVQGLVANSDVTSPMYMMVSNLNLSYSAFFRAIPYGGPEVQVTGPNPNSTVSGITSLLVSITDLSGTTSTNQQLIITVNGLPARFALGPNNGIALDTRYAPSGTQEIEVTVGSVPVAFDPQNPPIDTKLQYSGTATLALDFRIFGEFSGWF
jgi:hypothetical protein